MSMILVVFTILISGYTMLLHSETTIRGKKKSLARVTLVACYNAIGTKKAHIRMIGKAKEFACIVGNSWPLPYLAQKSGLIKCLYLVFVLELIAKCF